jgi:hypothetical protein
MRLISDTVVFRACALAQSAAMAVVLGASAASATTFGFVIDDTMEGRITVVRAKDLNPIGIDTDFGEVAQHSFILNGRYDPSAFPYRVNIFGQPGTDEAGQLSDTFQITMGGQPAPDNVLFTYTFISEVEGGPPLSPLLPINGRDPVVIMENGEIQSLFPMIDDEETNPFILGSLSPRTDDVALFGFQSDVEVVPSPIVGAGLPGLIAACGGLLALARRRRRTV